MFKQLLRWLLKSQLRKEYQTMTNLNSAIFKDKVDSRSIISAKIREIDNTIQAIAKALEYKDVKPAGHTDLNRKIRSIDEKTGKEVISYEDSVRTVSNFKVTDNYESYCLIKDHLLSFKLQFYTIRDKSISEVDKIAEVDSLYKLMIETLPCELKLETHEVVGKDNLKMRVECIRECRGDPDRSSNTLSPQELGSHMDQLSDRINTLSKNVELEKNVQDLDNFYQKKTGHSLTGKTNSDKPLRPDEIRKLINT
jgi:hypothetical protein